MSIEITALVVSLLAVVIAAYLFWRRNTPLTTSNVIATLQESFPIAQTLAKVAEIAVHAAEQYKLTGKIKSNDEALNFAIDFVKKWSPLTAQIENEKIIAAIEAAVLSANALRAQIEAAQKRHSEGL